MEVTDVSACLSQLQRFLLGTQEVARSRESLLLVEQVFVIHSNCVLIFSELEQTLDSIGSDEPMQPIKLAKWMLKEQSITTLLWRLKASKMSLNLILTTLTW